MECINSISFTFFVGCLCNILPSYDTIPSKIWAGILSQYSDLLRAGRSGDRIVVGGGARFSAPVQTGVGAHPVSYAMGTGSFPGVKRPGRGIYHQPPSSAEVNERVVPHWTFIACSVMNFTFS